MDRPITDSPSERDILEDAERLKTLYAVNDMLKQVVAEGLDINTILPRVLRVALAELDAFSGSIIVVDEDGEPQYSWLITGDEMEETANPFLREVVKRGLFAAATENQKTIVVDDTRSDERWLPRPNHFTEVEPWSAICCPIVVRSRAVGAITMIRPGRHQFDDHDISLLEAISSQAASTIESARLYRDSETRAEELTALVRATAALSTSLDPKKVLQQVAEQMVNLLGVDVGLIYDWENGRFCRRAYEGRLVPAENMEASDSFDPNHYPTTLEAVRRASPIHIFPDSFGLSERERAEIKRLGIRSGILLPLKARDTVRGLVVLLDTTEGKSFDPDEINFAQMLANQASIAIENARLYEDSQRQLRVSALLNDASQMINSTLDTNQILQSLLSQMNELLHAEALSIALVDQQDNTLVYEVAEGIGSESIIGLRLPSNQGISGWVMEQGQPALVNNARQDERFNEQGDERTGHDTRAMICAPLRVKAEVLGTVQAINPLHGIFTEDDLQLLINLANLAGTALANAKQFARTQAAEARYLSLFEENINPILLTDELGHIVEANRRACEFLGKSHKELLGLPISALHAGSHAQGDLPSFDAFSPQTTETFTSRVNTPERPDVPVEVHVKRTLSGNLELLQWIYRDITQELELEEMREDLMAMLVHDLQSPLGNIISSLELMRYELPPDGDPVLNSIVDIAARSSSRLQTLIHSLLDITRLESGHPITEADYTSLTTLIEDAKEIVMPVMERRRSKLVVNMSADAPELFADADMIRRVLINLLDNASKYTPEGKPITVEMVAADETGMAQISISDRGRGIPVEYRTIIFDKFRRVQSEKEGPKGLGLGLAFCRLAVEAHGGRIWIDDAPGGGARFNFTLPTEPFSSP